MLSSTFFISVAVLIVMAAAGARFSKLPANIWWLFIAQPLALSSSSMVVFAGGLLATKIAPEPELATLPLTLMILGTASAVIPASLLMKKIGRKRGTLIGLTVALMGAGLCALAALQSQFTLLVIGGGLLGMSMAFVAQMRFAAIESLLDHKDSASAVSALMVSGMFAAMLGPEVAANLKDWIASPHGFAGSFVGLLVMILIAMLLLTRLKPMQVPAHHSHGHARPLIQIIKQPIYLVAVASGAIGYSTMSYVMTATPLSMHEVHHHSLEATKWVVQSHIIAMYLPGLFFAALVRRFGVSTMMVIGSLTFIAVLIVALSGHQVMHYWWAMVLLGVGWNFLYTSGTILLPESYQPVERFKVQAVNDFSIFLLQAIASLSAGMILFSTGWQTMIWVAMPVVGMMLLVSVWFWWRRSMGVSEAVSG